MPKVSSTSKVRFAPQAQDLGREASKHAPLGAEARPSKGATRRRYGGSAAALTDALSTLTLGHVAKVPSHREVEARLEATLTPRHKKKIARADALDAAIERYLGKKTLAWIGTEQAAGNFAGRDVAERILDASLAQAPMVQLAGRRIFTLPPALLGLAGQRRAVDLRANKLATLPPELFLYSKLTAVHWRNSVLTFVGSDDNLTGARNVTLATLGLRDNPVTDILDALPSPCAASDAFNVFAYVERYGAAKLPRLPEPYDLVDLAEVKTVLQQAPESATARPWQPL